MKTLKRESMILASQENFHNVFDNVNDQIIIIDKDYKIIQANKSFCNKYGITKEEAMGQFCYKITHGRDKICGTSDGSCPAKKVWMVGKSFEDTHIHYVKGNKVFIKLLAYPVKDEKGNITHIIKIERDITERKRFEEELIKSEKKYHNLFNSAPDGISILDGNGNIIDCNPFEEKLLGLSKEKIIGKHVTNFFKEDQIQKFNQNFPNMKKEGSIEAEIDIRHNSGKYIPIWRRATAIYDDNKNFLGVLVHSRDITERKKREQELKESKEKELEEEALKNNAYTCLYKPLDQGKVIAFI